MSEIEIKQTVVLVELLAWQLYRDVRALPALEGLGLISAGAGASSRSVEQARLDQLLRDLLDHHFAIGMPSDQEDNGFQKALDEAISLTSFT